MLYLKNEFKNLLHDEEGMGTLEVLLIVAVLVAIALLFRDKITEWVNTILNKSDTQINNF